MKWVKESVLYTWVISREDMEFTHKKNKLYLLYKGNKW